MIIIPIGHEEATVRRLPWVTFSVIFLCFAALFAAGGAGLESRHDRELAESFEEAQNFYFQHPYLELHPEFRRMIAVFNGDPKAEQFLEMLKEALAPPGPEQLAAEQTQLDERVEAALSALQTHPYMRFGLVPGDVDFLSLLTHMFMHAGWLHLLGNMLLLYLAGPYIEDVWGRPLYAAFYVLSGVAASLLFVSKNPSVTVPLVGASGAIAGVMGAFLVRYWSTKIRFFYLFGFFIRGTFDAPAWLMLPMWLAQQFLMAALVSDVQAQGGGVAYWAHIGGFLFGAVFALVIRGQNIEERFIHPAIEGKTNRTFVDNTVVQQALEAQLNGDGERALCLLEKEVRLHPGNHDAAVAYWDVALELGRPREAGQAMLRAVQNELRAGDREQAVKYWLEVSGHVPDLAVQGALCVRLSEALFDVGRPEDGMVLLRRALLEGGTELGPKLALQIAHVARSRDDQLAAGALRMALCSADIDPQMRRCLEEMLAQVSPARENAQFI